MIPIDPEKPDDGDRTSAAAAADATPMQSKIVRQRQRFRHYERWCDARGLNANVPSASSIAAYIEDFAADVAYLTHRNRVESLKSTYVSRGIAWPTNDGPIRWALESVRHRKGARASRPLSEDDLDDLARSMSQSEQERDVHDWALMSLASELGLEASDVIRLRPDNLRFDGVSSVSLVGMHLNRAKISTAFAHPDAHRCAVRALQMWVDARDASMATLFYVSKTIANQRPLNRRDVNGIVMRRMNAIGRTAQRYSAQSMTTYGLFGRGPHQSSPRRDIEHS